MWILYIGRDTNSRVAGSGEAERRQIRLGKRIIATGFGLGLDLVFCETQSAKGCSSRGSPRLRLGSTGFSKLSKEGGRFY